MCDLYLFSGFRPKVPWIACFPVDGDPPRPSEREVSKIPDVLVAISKFGKRMVRKYWGEDAVYIPHAVLDDFRPVRKERAKEAFGIDAEKIVFGYNGSNDVRKLLNVLLQAWKRAFGDSDDTLLLLNTPRVRNSPRSFDTTALIEGLQVENCLIPFETLVRPPSRAEINLFYNALDVHVMVTGGEGFGLPIAESMACGVPNIGTNFSAIPEIMGGGGVKVRVRTVLLDTFGSGKAIPEVSDVARKMKLLKEREELRKELGNCALMEADRYRMEKVAPLWEDLVERVLQEKYIRGKRKTLHR